MHLTMIPNVALQYLLKYQIFRKLKLAKIRISYFQRMPRGRHGGGHGGGLNISVSFDLVRTVSACPSPSLSEVTQLSLQSFASEIKNGEVARTAVAKSNILQHLLSELEHENKNNARLQRVHTNRFCHLMMILLGSRL